MGNLLQEIHRLDQEVTLFINSFHSGFTDEIMKFFSDIPVWIPMYAAVVVFLFIRLGWKKALVVTASAALAFGMCDQFSNLIKDAVGFRHDRRLKYRGYAAWIFFWAFMVSISRIFVGKHYLGDVLVGMTVGVLFGLFTAFLADLVIRKIHRKS